MSLVMPELKTKSPYLLETAKGAIELTKGMYLSLIRRRALVGKNTSKKEMENEEDQAKTARKNQHSHYRKLIGKARTVKKTSKVNPDPILQNKRYVSLSKGLYRKRFELYEDSHIFPQEIQQFQLSQQFDNDCESDEEEIKLGVSSALMSLCLATYDSRWKSNS